MPRVRTSNEPGDASWTWIGKGAVLFGASPRGGVFASAAPRAAAPVKPQVPDETCRRGHPWTPENTYWQGSRGVRICRACKDASQIAYRQRRRARSNA